MIVAALHKLLHIVRLPFEPGRSERQRLGAANNGFEFAHFHVPQSQTTNKRSGDDSLHAVQC